MNDHPPDIVFISWAPDCSRSDGIAKKLGGVSLTIYSPFWGSRWSTIAFKYTMQAVRTLVALFRLRPSAVFVMAPPIVACLPVLVYAKIRGAKYVIDSHTAAFLYEPWKSLLFLHRFFSRRAVATMVTNAYLGGIVESWGARHMIVRDVPIDFPDPDAPGSNRQFTITLVNTFTDDEPLDMFLLAAARVPDVRFFVTGKLADADRSLVDKSPANVTFTDFLPKPKYANLLVVSDAVMSLTTLDHTMQRGAYEAVYLGKPVVTSDFGILREAFHCGTVFVKNTAESIAGGVLEMRMNLPRYREEVAALRDEKLERWRAVENDLRKILQIA